MKKILINNKYLLSIFLIIEIILFILTIYSFYFKSLKQNIFIFTIIILNIITFYFYILICRNQKKQVYLDTQKELMKKQAKIQEEYNLVTKENYKIMEKIKNSIYFELDKNNFDALQNKTIKDYVNQLINKKSSFYLTNYCENKIIDAILYNKSLICKKNDINISIEVYLKDNLLIKEIDLISIFTNLLDNAIEASMFLNKKNRKISINSRIINNYLVLKITNNYNNSIFNTNFSTIKKDKENHGFGIKIIKEIVKKYDGTLKINKTDKTIEFSITLKNIPL